MANAVTDLSPAEWLLREETYEVPEGELSTTTVLLFALEISPEEYKRLILILGGTA